VGDPPAETQAEQRREWGDLVDDAQAPIWLALCQEQAVGCQGYFPAPASEDNSLIQSSASSWVSPVPASGSVDGGSGRH
jgi:hypothetical protein